MMAEMGAQLRAVGASLQSLPKPPYIVLSAQGTTTFSALSGMYVPIYMHKYVHDAADASKGGVFTFAFVKGPVNQEMWSVAYFFCDDERVLLAFTSTSHFLSMRARRAFDCARNRPLPPK